MLSEIGELANMISGNAAIGLANAGFSCRISLAFVVQFAGSRFTADKVQQICVVFGSDLGTLHVKIGLHQPSNANELAWLQTHYQAIAGRGEQELSQQQSPTSPSPPSQTIADGTLPFGSPDI